MSVLVEERVTNLEQLMAQLIQTVEQTSREMAEFKEEMRISRAESRREMREFKTESRREMREFKAEMAEFKDEMAEFKDEMAEFKDEMAEFKDEMAEFKDEMKDFKTETRKQWGELSHKMGTMAEDLVAPSIPQVIQSVVDCPADSLESAVRVKRRTSDGQLREFDVIATCGNYLFINETKSRLNPENIKTFIEETLPTTRDFFPEHATKQVIGIVASLYVDESLVRYGERQGLVVLGFGQDVMDVLNSPNFTPKMW